MGSKNSKKKDEQESPGKFLNKLFRKLISIFYILLEEEVLERFGKFILKDYVSYMQ